ncbi:polyurethanase [Jejubacter calystegiae]|uniref:Polyurethanase n=1 Tax=Jejubacter calystegiae TaxID=2579935 RepID=A0A4P8YF92_9ENTR|nr:polyurethanase [Jejubacter calystegiae]QCT19305.1 polyurethanase [Jejubacter calystegiae]
MSFFEYRDFEQRTLANDYISILQSTTNLFTGSDIDINANQENFTWKILSGEDIGYSGLSGSHDEFYGEVLALLTSQVNILGKYDDNGKLVGLGINFWGTGAAADDPLGWLHLLVDGAVDIAIGLGESGLSNGYILTAFNNLLTHVAEFATENGLTGRDVLITGHSMGGMGVNSMAAASSQGAWGGFYESSAYIGSASPTQNQLDDKVLNIGLENDPVFRVLEGDDITWDSALAHDKSLPGCSNNLIAFNDYYTQGHIFSLLNVTDWQYGHDMNWYINAVNTIMNSASYNYMDLDSTIITAQLSDELRTTTWVEDINHDARSHTGPTFILGSEKADLISGGAGIDYLEGFTGDDTFRDAGSSNIIFGGDGYDLFDLQSEISKTSVAQSVTGMTFIKGADGGITLLQDVEAIRETYWEWFQTRTITYEITCRGLEVDDNVALGYANAVHGSMTGQASEIFAPQDGGFYTNTTSWLFSYNGDTIMHGSTTDDVFICGIGNDQMYANGGSDTFLFASDNFGHNAIYGFGSDDQIVILANKETTANSSWLDYLSEDSDGLMFSCGESSVSLVGLSLDQVHENQFVLA